MSPLSSFLAIILAFIVNIMILPWLPLLGVTIPITLIVLATFINQLDAEATALALLIGGWIHDVWLSPATNLQFMAWSAVVVAWLVLNRSSQNSSEKPNQNKLVFFIFAALIYEVILAVFSLNAGAQALFVHGLLVTFVGVLSILIVQILARQLEKVI